MTPLEAPHPIRPAASWAAVLALLALGGGCAEGFDPFEQVTPLRVIAFGADKPALAPGETTTLSALLHTEPDQDVSYEWEWCPFPTGAQNEYKCELDDVAGDMGGMALPPIDFSLGTDPSVDFLYPIPPEFLRQICDGFQQAGEELPDFISLPDCETSFPITLRLVTAAPGGQRVVAIKSLRLLYEAPEDPATLNTNPVIKGVSIIEEGKDVEDAQPIDADDPPVLERDTNYTIVLDIDDDQAQRYQDVPDILNPNLEERLENLAVTWFFEDGEMENGNTGFIEGTLTYDDLRQNVFTTPLAKDFPDKELNLYFVMRDNRGGVGWYRTTVGLK